MNRLLGLLMIMLFLTACSNEEKDTVMISAAASLTDALTEIETVFKETHPEINIEFNFGGSGALREQVKQGAPVDMVIFASQKDFDLLGKSVDYLKQDNLLQNTLVLIVPKSNEKVTGVDSLNSAEKVAIGTSKSVPAGYYAEQALDSLGLKERIEDKFIYAEDVRAVLQYVAQGEVDAGIVYRTDALLDNKVKIVDTFEKDTHEKIVYPVGTLTDSEATDQFYEFLQTKEATDIFKKYGFTVE